MAAIDLKDHLVAGARKGCERLINDLKAIPADRQNVSPGGCARAPLAYVAECGALNGMIAEVLQTGALPDSARATPEQRAAFLASFDTEEKALAYLKENTEKLIAVFEALDLDTLGNTTDAIFGRTMTRYAIAELPAMHMSYHDGQLCYVQSMCGDNQVHWG